MKPRSLFGAIFAWICLGGIALQQEEVVIVQASQHPTFGAYLTDGAGRSLYTSLNDAKNSSTCYDECARNWPPLLVKGKLTAGKGVAPNLLGTIQRKDGTVQVTYNGLPLYYYAGDQKAGDFHGQGASGVWFLVSPNGEVIKVRVTQQPTGAAQVPAGVQTDALLAQLKTEGQAVYSRLCVTCHGAEGQGGIGARLAGNTQLVNIRLVIGQIVSGGEQMPAFGGLLSDREVAAVATYIRNSWGNQFGLITEEEVKALRGR